MDELLQRAGEIGWALAIFAIALPVEHLFGTGYTPRLQERLGNVGAMIVHFVLGGALLTAVLRTPALAPWTDFPDAPRWSVLENPWIYALAAMFCIDGLYYVYHRLQHAVPLLWHIHALHHTDPAVNITTARRTHFLERPIQFLVLALPALWLLGYNESGAVIATVAGQAALLVSHLDVKLPFGRLTPVVVGPQYHRMHHGLEAHHGGTNFAQAFPLFDLIGGTYRAPGPGEYVATGIEGCDTAVARWRPILW